MSKGVVITRSTACWYLDNPKNPIPEQRKGPYSFYTLYEKYELQLIHEQTKIWRKTENDTWKPYTFAELLAKWGHPQHQPTPELAVPNLSPSKRQEPHPPQPLPSQQQPSQTYKNQQHYPPLARPHHPEPKQAKPSFSFENFIASLKNYFDVQNMSHAQLVVFGLLPALFLLVILVNRYNINSRSRPLPPVETLPLQQPAQPTAQLKTSSQHSPQYSNICGRMVTNGFELAVLGAEEAHFPSAWIKSPLSQACNTQPCAVYASLADGTQLTLSFSSTTLVSALPPNARMLDFCGKIYARSARSVWISVTKINGHKL